jgi:hypothetical protein
MAPYRTSVDISTEGRGNERVHGNARGLYVGSLGGVKWVSWGTKSDFVNMCATFDREAARYNKKPVRDTDAKKLSSLYRLEFIQKGGPSKYVEAVSTDAQVAEHLRRMLRERKYVSMVVSQYGLPVQTFGRLANGAWFAALKNGPFAHLVRLHGGS